MIPSGAQMWIALGHTDMRKGMQDLALLVQQGIKRNPDGGDLFVFAVADRYSWDSCAARTAELYCRANS